MQSGCLPLLRHQSEPQSQEDTRELQPRQQRLDFSHAVYLDSFFSTPLSSKYGRTDSVPSRTACQEC